MIVALAVSDTDNNQ